MWWCNLVLGLLLALALLLGPDLALVLGPPLDLVLPPVLVLGLLVLLARSRTQGE